MAVDIGITETLLRISRTNYVIMRHLTGPRAATIRKLIDGSAWNRTRPHQTKIIVLPGLLDKAEQLRICAPKGRGNIRTIGTYFEDCLIRDIREYEKLKEDILQKKLGIVQANPHQFIGGIQP